MFLGDKGKPTTYGTVRLNYDIIIDDEKFTLQKLTQKLGFYTVLFDSKIKDVEVVYDTDKKLLTGAGLIIRKKITPKRTYFSLVRVSSMNNIQSREKKSFLGECETQDQPSDFPVQIADAINKIFNNLFTINVVDIVKHCTPYIRIELSGNKYKVVSGTGYEAEISFENLKVKNARTGRKGKQRIFSLKMELDPNYERERQHILDTIDRYCKELAPLNRNRFEIAQILVEPPVVEVSKKTDNNDKEAQNLKNGKNKKDKKNKKSKKSGEV